MLKKTMLAAAVAALALAALPAVAAADIEADFTGSKHFTVEGGEAQLKASTNITCSSVTGTGEFENSQTGTIKFTFHGCKESSFGIKCTSPEQESGTITTTKLPFHLVTAVDDPTEETTNGVLITPTNPDPETHEGHFATFNCSFLAHIEVIGTGIIGEITAPGLNEASSNFTIEFAESENGGQTHKTAHGYETPEEFGLTAAINSGEAEPAVEIAEGTGTFSEEGEATLTSTE